MKRDMDLVRLILLKIEEDYVSTALYNIDIDGYDKETIAYHCRILYEAGFILDYDDYYADDELESFAVSALTWEGHELLEKVRDNSRWANIKSIIKGKALPFSIDVLKSVATTLIAAATEGAVTAYLKNGGQP